MILSRLARTYQAARPMSLDADQAFSHRGALREGGRESNALNGTALAGRSWKDMRLNYDAGMMGYSQVKQM